MPEYTETPTTPEGSSFAEVTWKQYAFDPVVNKYKVTVEDTGLEVVIIVNKDGETHWRQHFNPDKAIYKIVGKEVEYTARYAYALRSFLEWWKKTEGSMVPFPKMRYLEGTTNVEMNTLRSRLLGEDVYQSEQNTDEIKDFMYSLDLEALVGNAPALKKLEALSARYLRQKP